MERRKEKTPAPHPAIVGVGGEGETTQGCTLVMLLTGRGRGTIDLAQETPVLQVSSQQQEVTRGHL